MYTGRKYGLLQTIHWSRINFLIPGLWSTLLTILYQVTNAQWLALPWLPMSALGIAVAFFLGFKNNAAYERLWEARKIWGGIVNVSRAWAYGVRDLVTSRFDNHAAGGADLIREHHVRLIRRHIAWMDALRHQLRTTRSWEHSAHWSKASRARAHVPEDEEDLERVLSTQIGEQETTPLMTCQNAAALLIAAQSRHLADLRHRRWLDPFSHMKLQTLLDDLVALQGQAERIKNFPFPRQYATINALFARLFTLLIPLGFLDAFASHGGSAWATIPFSTVVSWVFLTSDQLGDWSENPFEGLPNDVPISTLSRKIERDVLEILGEEELPEPRPLVQMVAY
ncbi:MAG: bestrophin family protein [Myxococcota bacterium]